jgi:hypothetical protein
MKGSLNRADIEQAKQQMALRRADILRRHADELGRLDTDQTDLDALHRLIGVFAQKYGTVPVVPEAPLAPKAPAAREAPAAVKVAIEPTVHRHAREAVRSEQRDYGRTNFGTFARAMAKSAY